MRERRALLMTDIHRSRTMAKKLTEATHPNRAVFPSGIGGPALRALQLDGVRSLADLEERTEKDLLALHGMGPKAIGILRDALAASGRHLRQA
jgi:hypothetical protein